MPAPPPTATTTEEMCIRNSVDPVNKMQVFTVAWIKSVKIISHIKKRSKWVDSQIPKTRVRVVILLISLVSICLKGI